MLSNVVKQNTMIAFKGLRVKTRQYSGIYLSTYHTNLQYVVNDRNTGLRSWKQIWNRIILLVMIAQCGVNGDHKFVQGIIYQLCVKILVMQKYFTITSKVAFLKPSSQSNNEVNIQKYITAKACNRQRKTSEIQKKWNHISSNAPRFNTSTINQTLHKTIMAVLTTALKLQSILFKSYKDNTSLVKIFKLHIKINWWLSSSSSAAAPSFQCTPFYRHTNRHSQQLQMHNKTVQDF